MDIVRAVGETVLPRSTSLGGVSKSSTSGSDNDGQERKRGSKSVLANWMAVRAAAKDSEEREVERA